MSDHSADTVRAMKDQLAYLESLPSADPVQVYVIAIQTAMVKRADREALWHMKLYDVDLEAMAFEIAESLRLIDGSQ